MNKGILTVHCLIRNEENWIWFAINSVLNYVDKVIVYDTGSTDNTVEVIKTIKSPKIIFEEKGTVDKIKFVRLRQEMLDRTKTDWFMILDGDEIWPKKTIEELVYKVRLSSSEKKAVVVRQWTCLGDIFHYCQELTNVNHQFMPKNLIGFGITRAIKKIPGLHCIGEYGFESYADRKKHDVAYWHKKNIIYLENKFWHTTFLPRSQSIQKDRGVMMRANKHLFYQGKLLPKNIYFPEVFYLNKPKIVPFPWKKFTRKDMLVGIFYRVQNYLDNLLSMP